MSQHRNILATGLGLTLRNWPAFVWTYLFNLVTALVFTLPIRAQLHATADHSFAALGLSNGFDLGTLAGIIFKLTKGPGPAALSSNFTAPVYVLIYFFIVPGALLCYQSDAPAKLGSMLYTGFVYFWRFVRITLVNLVVSGIIIGGLMALQNLWAAHLSEKVVGRNGFILEMAGLAVIALIASALRLYFDLVEVYTVQLGLQVWPDGVAENPKRARQIRRTFRPALRTLGSRFFGAYITFLFLAALGLGAVALTVRISGHSLAQPRVWPSVLLVQLGLFIMLFTRFWQRGAETVLALEKPLPVPAAIVPLHTPIYVAPVAEPAYTTEVLEDPAALEAPPTEAGHLPHSNPNPNPDPNPDPNPAPNFEI